MKQFFRLLGSLLLLVNVVCDAQRHNLKNRSERYEERQLRDAEKSGSLEAALNKQTKQMTFDEAVRARDYYRSVNEIEMVLKCDERILAVGGDQEVMRLTRLELAELCLARNNLPDAIKHAEEYLLFYPGSDESKKAHLIALTGHYLSQLHSLRDQENTLKTVELAEQYLEKYPKDRQYVSMVQQMRHDSYLKLIRHELHVIATQVNSFHIASSPASLAAAQRRLTYIEDKLLPHAPAAKKRILELGITLDIASNNPEKAQEKEQELKRLTASQVSFKQESLTQATFSAIRDYFSENTSTFFA